MTAKSSPGIMQLDSTKEQKPIIENSTNVHKMELHTVDILQQIPFV